MDCETGTPVAFESHPLRSLLADQAEPANLPASKEIERLPFFRIRAADTSGERSSANILIDKMYSTRGYRTTALPEDETSNLITLVASDHQATIGTLTIGFDSGEGLLVDDLFPDEVERLRAGGRKVCEFTKLAMDNIIQSKRVLSALFNVAYLYAHKIKGADNLLIEVNPRHVRYYQAMWGFKAIGPKRLNRRVNAPAVLLSLDLHYCRQQIERYGGHHELSDTVRSLYPHTFSPREEAGIIGRLRRTEVRMTQIYGFEPAVAGANHSTIPGGFADAPLLHSQGKVHRGGDFGRANA